MSSGYLPSTSEFKSFLDEHDLACQAWQGPHWEDWCAEAATQIAQQGLPEPNPYPSKDPPERWQRLELDLSDQPRRHTAEYTCLQVLDAVYEFKLNLRSSETPSDRRYKAFARGVRDVPSVAVVNHHGGLHALLEETALPGWRKRAVEAEDAHRQEAADARAAVLEQQQREHAARRQKPRRRDPRDAAAVPRVVPQRGPLANRDLVKALKLSRTSVWKVFRELEQRGLVEATEENPRAPKQRYRLTIAGHRASQDEAALREQLSWPIPDSAVEESTSTTREDDSDREKAR